MCQQEVEDEALYSMHIPASVYRVRGLRWGLLLHGLWWLCLSWDVASRMSGSPRSGWDIPKEQQPWDVPACRERCPLCSSSPARHQGLLQTPLHPVQCWFTLFIPLQIRKGPSASSVPFPPSSPLLSCPPDGARHMVMYWERGSSWGGETPIPVLGWSWAGLDATPLPCRASWTGTAVAPTATMTTRRRVRS